MVSEALNLARKTFFRKVLILVLGGYGLGVTNFFILTTPFQVLILVLGGYGLGALADLAEWLGVEKS